MVRLGGTPIVPDFNINYTGPLTCTHETVSSWPGELWTAGIRPGSPELMNACHLAANDDFGI